MRGVGDTTFFVSWGIWLVTRMLQETSALNDSLPPIARLALGSSLLLLILSEIASRQRYGRRDAIAGVILLVLLASAIKSGSKDLLYGFLFVYRARAIPFRKVAFFTFLVLLGTFLVIVVPALVNYEPIAIVGPGGEERLRSSLGFAWPSRAPNYFLVLVMLYVFLRGEKVSLVDLAVAGLLATLIFLSTDSRNPFLSVIFLLFSAKLLFLLRKPLGKTPLGSICKASFLVFALSMVLLSITYDPSNGFLREMNALMSGRLLYSHNAFQTTLPTLFGTSVFGGSVDGFDPLGTGYLDSGFLRLLCVNGLVPFVVVFAAFAYVTNEAVRLDDKALYACLLCVVVHSIMEGQLLLLQFTPFFFLAGNWFTGGVGSTGQALSYHAKKNAVRNQPYRMVNES